MTHVITRKFTFDSGHRIPLHESKCKHLHGHTFMCEVSLSPVDGDTLDDLGRVLDFGEIKRLIGTWIDVNVDHGFILNSTDELVKIWPHNHKLYLIGKNPTAENIAEHFHKVFGRILSENGIAAKVIRVTIHETPNSRAEYYT